MDLNEIAEAHKKRKEDDELFLNSDKWEEEVIGDKPNLNFNHLRKLKEKHDKACEGGK